MKTLFALAGIFLLVLTGCFSEGGDDYPNSIQPLGRYAASERSDTSQWNAYEDAPTTAPGIYDTTKVPENAPDSSTPDRAVFGGVPPSLNIDLGADIEAAIRSVQVTYDTASGVTRAIRSQWVNIFGFAAVDTTWYKTEGLNVRLVKVSGQVAVGGDVRYSSFEDGDGDGYLSPAMGASRVVKMRFVTVFASGMREEQSQRVDAGPDGDFNTQEDNTLLSLQKVKMQALDTLMSLILRDADGDGFIFNPLRILNQIEVESKIVSEKGRTVTDYSFAAFADSTRNYPYRYQRVFTGEGHQESVVALGRDSLPDFAAGDSGSVRIRFSSSVETDTLETSEIRYGVLLSATAGKSAENRLNFVSREKSFRFGNVSKLTYRLIPDAAVVSGAFPFTGALFIRTDLATGDWVQFEGQAGMDIAGTFIDSHGKQGVVHFDFNGQVK